jgi:hypothetical protein
MGVPAEGVVVAQGFDPSAWDCLMADWTAPYFVDALTAAVAARADIQAMSDPTVTVLSYDPGIDADVGDLMVIGYELSDVNEPAALGRNRYKETVDVVCSLQVIRYEASANNGSASAAARLRASDMLGAVDNTLRLADGTTNANPHLKVGDQTTRMQIISRDLTLFPSFDLNGAPVQVCRIDFTVQYEAYTSPSSE